MWYLEALPEAGTDEWRYEVIGCGADADGDALVSSASQMAEGAGDSSDWSA